MFEDMDRMDHVVDAGAEPPAPEREEPRRPEDCPVPPPPPGPHGPEEHPVPPPPPPGPHGPEEHPVPPPPPPGPHGPGEHPVPPPPPPEPHGPGEHPVPPPPPPGPHGPGGHPVPPPPPPPPGPHGPGRGHGPHIDREQYAAMDTEGKLFALIGELGHASRFLLDGRTGQNRALDLLREGESMTQRELTERLGIRPGSASELVGKLERAGLIQRTPSELDRRTADIRLTEAGLARREERAGQEKEAVAELFAALSEEEKETLLALLEKLRAAWQELTRPEPTGRPGP